jgi:hypothetical protein
MRYRWARWTLLIVAVAAAVSVCVWALDLERQLREERAALGVVAARGIAARVALNDVRRALAAMATPGQAAAGWSRRAAAAIDEARRQMTGLPATVTPGTAAGPRDGDVLERLSEAEQRVREHAVGGKGLMATDVAFGEAMPLVDELERRVGDGVTTATVAAERGMATLRDRQVAALAGALGGLLLTALLLTPLPQVRSAARVVGEPSAETRAPDAAPVPDLVPLVEPAPVGASQPPPESPVSLDGLNRVCAALAKLTEAQTLPLVLEQLAAAIGARGVIVWLADSDRRELRAAASAGYDPRLLERYGPVTVEDRHPTARAWSSGQTTITPASPGRAAAVAVPIAGPHGVCGVLSVELRAGDHAGVAASAAAAGIAAAQLAVLVGPAAQPAADDEPGAAPAQIAPR